MIAAERIAIVAHALAAIASLVAFAVARPPAPPRLAGRTGALAAAGRWAYWASRPMVRGAQAAHLSANAMTGVGVALTLLAALAAGAGFFGWAALLLLWGGACDMLDGELARATGTASAAGAFLDSNLDRVSEIALFAGLAVAFPDRAGVLWAGGALVASLMVSYARARGEGLGVACPPFGLERPHRLVLMLAALVAAPFLPRREAVAVVELACAAVAVGAGATAAGRMVVIHQLLRRGREPGRASGPR